MTDQLHQYYFGHNLSRQENTEASPQKRRVGT